MAEFQFILSALQRKRRLEIVAETSAWVVRIDAPVLPPRSPRRIAPFRLPICAGGNKRRGSAPRPLTWRAGHLDRKRLQRLAVDFRFAIHCCRTFVPKFRHTHPSRKRSSEITCAPTSRSVSVCGWDLYQVLNFITFHIKSKPFFTASPHYIKSSYCRVQPSKLFPGKVILPPGRK